MADIMRENKKKIDMKLMIMGIIAGALLALCAPLLSFSGSTVMRSEPMPVQELTGFWGDFDEIRLFRYFRLEDVPEASGVPAGDTEYHGATYRLVSVDGPLQTEFGDCWEAMYVEEGVD